MRQLIFLLIFLLPLSAEDKPNILFIFADDQCFRTLGGTNNTEIQTPHLDRLRSKGILFSEAYNMGAWNGAVCLASRKMINTGRFLWRSQPLNLKNELAEGRMWGPLMNSAVKERIMRREI